MKAFKTGFIFILNEFCSELWAGCRWRVSWEQNWTTESFYSLVNEVENLSESLLIWKRAAECRAEVSDGAVHVHRLLFVAWPVCPLFVVTSFFSKDLCFCFSGNANVKCLKIIQTQNIRSLWFPLVCDLGCFLSLFCSASALLWCFMFSCTYYWRFWWRVYFPTVTALLFDSHRSLFQCGNFDLRSQQRHRFELWFQILYMV